ncbi:hypothetical protein H5P27_08590 [Pelagicoccus albus]|uniref:Uncharacterized protein n=2 Tax=Pelagicoccus albus TaxID=415222 RepID=A0A7X1B5P0_9BACT|nr:hypothetical protein [Pelagicoccus albus]
MPKRENRMLFWLLVANVIATVLHYVDNIYYFHQYPEPDWLNPHIVDAFWFAMTPFAALGYVLFKKDRFHLGCISLYIYSSASLLVLGHYNYGDICSISFRINFFILFEATLASILMLYVAFLQSSLFRKLPNQLSPN